MDKDSEVHQLKVELRKLSAELEQARVVSEDAQYQNNALAEECRRLVRELRERRHRESAAEEALLDLRSQLDDAGSGPFPEARPLDRSTVEEELRVTVEELQVLAEELDIANEALRQSNALLEQHVLERTAELAASNASLREAEQRLRLSMRHADAGTWDLDNESGRMSWSQEFRDLCGLPSDDTEASRSAWLDSIAAEDRARTAQALQDCLDQRLPELRIEYRVQHPAKGLRWLVARGRLVFDAAGRSRMLAGLAIDVTERKRAQLALEQLNVELNTRVEQEVAARKEAQAKQFQRQKLEALGQLTGGVAHDFNNLLMVLTSGLDMLARAEDPARRAELVHRIQGAAGKGAELTRRLLAFGRRQELRPEPLDVAAYMDNLRELLRHSLRADLNIVTRCDEALWTIKVDVGALELALLNLAVNARDAMPGGGTLTLSARNRRLQSDAAAALGLAAGDYVELSVSDEGVGMAPEVLTRVFEPFFTTKPVGQGTGLGLPQVYGFAQQSGGMAAVQSRPGEGTRVALLLPRTAEPARSLAEQPMVAGAQPRTELEAAHPIREAWILVVEDDDDVATLVIELLTQFGHHVTRVSTAAEALGILEQRTERSPIDLVFTDVLLPGGQSGLDLAHQLAQHESAPLILLTTGYFGDEASYESRAGLPVLRKPYSVEALKQTIDRVLRSSTASPRMM